MAKKIHKEESEDKGGHKLALDVMDAKFISKYGDYITTGDKVLEQKRNYKTISFSPAINLALSNGKSIRQGIKEGSWVILSGPSKQGKTSSAMQLIVNCQEEGRKIIYIDAEGRLKEMNFEIDGIDPSKVLVIQAKDRPVSAEEYLEMARQLVSMKENEGCLLIIDSVSALIPSKDLEVDVSGTMRPGLPKILGDFCKKMGQIVPNQKSIVILITHMITNTSGYGPSRTADSGVKIQYQADTRMEVKSAQKWDIGTQQTPEIIGLQVNWNILCSSIGSPFKECSSFIRFGKGIDKAQELLIIGMEFGLIQKAGSWITLSFLEGKGLSEDIKTKVQGEAKARDIIANHPEVYNLLEQEIEDMLV